MAKSPLEVLFEDNHLIVVVKPAGIPAQPDQGSSSGEGASLLEVTKEWLKQKYLKPGNVFLGLVHRLDKPVTGLMVFAKTSKAASRLGEQVRERRFAKGYQALVEGAPGSPLGRLENFLLRVGDKTVVVASDTVGSQSAKLSWKRVSAGPPCLLEIELETGRKHQIRCQLAAMGCPILGDQKYGAKRSFSPGIALVAHRLGFFHPIEKERWMEFQLPAHLNPLVGGVA